jgi:hypothetical protein
VASLETLYLEYQARQTEFQNTVARLFPDKDEWHWQRACARIDGHACRRNDDTSQDQAMADNAEIRAAWDAYIKALHAFYLLRDGPNGVLGGRGL